MNAVVAHTDLEAFGADRVNLKAEYVEKYREQGQRVRARLELYIADHPDFDFVKILNSGSLAKGTALSTLNDFDLAVYVRAAKAPSRDPELVDWMARLLKEAYSQLDEAQFVPEDHCVRIEFRSHGLIPIECVPVLYEGEADNVGYLITKGTGRRLKTRHTEFRFFRLQCG